MVSGSHTVCLQSPAGPTPALELHLAPPPRKAALCSASTGALEETVAPAITAADSELEGLARSALGATQA